MNGTTRQPTSVDLSVTRSDEVSLGSIRALMLAVLEDAMFCFQNTSQSRERAQAQAWFFDRSGDGPFAFEAICHVLSIDPDYLRRGLRQCRRRQLNGMETLLLLRRSPVTDKTRVCVLPSRRPTIRRKASAAGHG
jgi:hypothetical protein